MSKHARFTLIGGAIAFALVSFNAAKAATIVVGTENNVLNFIDTNTVSTTSSVTVTGTDRILADIAFDPDGNLYGITFSKLYSINLATGAASLIGALGGNDFNALTINTAGQAFTAGYYGDGLFGVNLGTGAATALGAIGNGFTGSSGDLEFANGALYGVDKNGGIDDLYALTTGPVSGVRLGSTGLEKLYGLAFADDTMFGVSGDAKTLFAINLLTGFASSLGPITGFTGGAIGYGAAALVSPVPLPAALPLFGTGLGLFGYLGWRRKRRQVEKGAVSG